MNNRMWIYFFVFNLFFNGFVLSLSLLKVAITSFLGMIFIAPGISMAPTGDMVYSFLWEASLAVLPFVVMLILGKIILCVSKDMEGK